MLLVSEDPSHDDKKALLLKVVGKYPSLQSLNGKHLAETILTKVCQKIYDSRRRRRTPKKKVIELEDTEEMENGKRMMNKALNSRNKHTSSGEISLRISPRL